jgi:hypothetical protein
MSTIDFSYRYSHGRDEQAAPGLLDRTLLRAIDPDPFLAGDDHDLGAEADQNHRPPSSV